MLGVKMRKKIIIMILILFSIFILAYFLLQKNIIGFTINQNYFSEQTLENLKVKANVECLKNSHCNENFECIESKCLPRENIDFCEKVSLSNNVRTLKVGNELNIAKRVLTRRDLPYLLSDGKLFKIIDGKLIEYYYSPVIIIGDNRIKEENLEYFIESKKDYPVYVYRLIFSNPIDFSDLEMQGQSLRILGDEYIISKNSSNLVIELILDNKKVRLENGEKVKNLDVSLVNIQKDDDGKVTLIDFFINKRENMKIKEKEKLTEFIFNRLELSFEIMNTDKTADIKIGGKC